MLTLYTTLTSAPCVAPHLGNTKAAAGLEAWPSKPLWAVQPLRGLFPYPLVRVKS